MKAVAYTDGSCGGNPGPMGWAALMCNDLYTKLKAG